MNGLFQKYKRFGIFGPSESGKTTLAKKIAFHLYQTEKRRAIVLDRVAKEYWGEHATVYTNQEQFNKDIYIATDALVVVDDGSVTINRDNELSGLFTTLRHQRHKLLVIGHSASNLLPQMREQLQRIFLFLQNRESVEKWEVVFPGADLTAATQLQQYEFLTVANYQPVQRFQLTK